MGEHPDLKLLASETAQQQVDRMGNGWTFQEQYDKQLELPVHLLVDEMVIREVTRDGGKRTQGVFLTKCGLEVGGEKTIRSASDAADVTCKACG